MTDNICVSYSLIHGSIGTVKHSDRRSKPLFSTIYIKFDDPKAANSLKDRRGCGKLKEYVPISARTKRFPLKKEKSTVIAEIIIIKKNSFHYLAMQILSSLR